MNQKKLRIWTLFTQCKRLKVVPQDKFLQRCLTEIYVRLYVTSQHKNTARLQCQNLTSAFFTKTIILIDYHILPKLMYFIKQNICLNLTPLNPGCLCIFWIGFYQLDVNSTNQIPVNIISLFVILEHFDALDEKKVNARKNYK